MTDQPRMTSEKPLFLAPMARGGHGIGPNDDRLGYVTYPGAGMRDEPECMGPAILDSYAESNQLRYSQQHALDVANQRLIRHTLKAEDRLKDAERRAKQAHRRDLKGEFLALRGMLTRAQRSGQQPKPTSSLIVRLERVEANLDGIPLT